MLPSATRAKYTVLLQEAGAPEELGYLWRAGPNERRVHQWFDSAARAVVIFTFDNHATNEGQIQILNDVLTANGITKATWYLTGAQTLGVNLLKDFDLGNHNDFHKVRNDFLTQNIDDFDALDRKWNALFGGRPITGANTFNTYRAPVCDGQKSFDRSVLDAFATFAFNRGASHVSDSSVPYLAPSASAAGVVPPWGLRQYVTDYPYPFRIRAGVVEFPAAYPSDGMAWFYHNMEDVQTPSVGGPGREGRVGFALDVWKAAFDDVYAREGVMTMLLHPHHMGANINGVKSPALRDLILHMKSKPGVVFTDIETATRKFNAAYPD